MRLKAVFLELVLKVENVSCPSTPALERVLSMFQTRDLNEFVGAGGV
jgi:hypothetical protein